jgi:hypothetical protein
MSTKPLRVAAVLGVLVGVALTACGSDPPLAPGSASIIRLALAGPDSLPPGATEVYRVTAQSSDGSQRDVTTEATWHTGDPSVLAVAPGGRVTAGMRGEADIRAAYSGLTTARRVLVLPAGTYKITGRVLDGNVGVPDARVEVTDGAAAGLSTLSSDGGFYALYGLTGTTRLNVSREGYRPLVESVEITGPRYLELRLSLLARPWDPSGTYTLTVNAAPECRDVLPEELRDRSYSATVETGSDPRGALITVPGVVWEYVNWYFWLARIDDNGLTLNADSYYGPPVVERLGGNKFFLLETAGTLARAELVRSPSGMAGTLEATLSLAAGSVWYSADRIASCRSVNHRMTLSR